MAAQVPLYYRPGACALGPHILLNLLGWTYDAIRALRDDSYKAINPTEAVPALKFADDHVLTQAGAILRDLAEAAERTDLLRGKLARERAEVTRWTSFLTGDFHPAFFPVFVPERYTTDASEASLAAAKQAGSVLVQTGLYEMQSQIAGRTHFIGNERTIVDAYAVPMLRWANIALSNGLDNWLVTAQFCADICADEGVVAAMRTQGMESA
ncbi:MAG: glutathione S-transferase [Pseudomonadota bacterium]